MGRFVRVLDNKIVRRVHANGLLGAAWIFRERWGADIKQICFRFARNLAIFAFSLIAILGLVLFERFNFSYGEDEFSNATLAGLHHFYLKNCRSAFYKCDQSLVIAGHRGSSVIGQMMDQGEISETIIGNTELGIKKAIQDKVDFIEVDLRAFKGTQKDLVLYHDSNLGKLILPSSLAGSNPQRIEALTIDEIRDSGYRTLDSKNSHLVFLSEFLALVAESNQKIILDLKFANLLDGATRTVAFENLVWQLDKHRIHSTRVTVFGDYQVLSEWNAFCRSCNIGDGLGRLNFQLGYTVLGKYSVNRIDVLLQPSLIFEKLSKLHEPGAELPILVLPVSFASHAMLSRADKFGADVWCYGTEDGYDWDSLKKRGVDGLILDQPAGYSQ